MLVGYMRVSSDPDRQTTDLQRDALLSAGVDSRHLFEDHASGAKDDRCGLAKALEFVKSSDVLVVWKLDRLGRSLSHLLSIVNELKDKQVAFRSLTEGMDTTTASGELLFHVFGALAQYERALTRERGDGRADSGSASRPGGWATAGDSRREAGCHSCCAGRWHVEGSRVPQLWRQAYYVDRDAGPDRYGSIFRRQFAMTSRVGAPDESWTLTPEDHARRCPSTVARGSASRCCWPSSAAPAGDGKLLTARTAERFRAEIRAGFGFREATVAVADALIVWLRDHAAPEAAGALDVLVERVETHCREQALKPPAPDHIDRIVRAAQAYRPDRDRRSWDNLVGHLLTNHPCFS